MPRDVETLRSLEDLLDYFAADRPQSLNRRIYKDTECGASISVQTPDGVWHHDGQDWSGITEIIAFTIQTIVEGSDAEINSNIFTFPVLTTAVDRWIEYMEEQADAIWCEANAEDDDAVPE